jgi:hypothetical protein
LFGWKPSRLYWQLAEDFARLPAWHNGCALATVHIPLMAGRIATTLVVNYLKKEKVV